MTKIEVKEELHLVMLWSVTPWLPKNKTESAFLREDLLQIGCAGFLRRPWNLKNEEMVEELLVD